MESLCDGISDIIEGGNEDEQCKIINSNIKIVYRLNKSKGHLLLCDLIDLRNNKNNHNTIEYSEDNILKHSRRSYPNYILADYDFWIKVE
jgi:hypothetical protein